MLVLGTEWASSIEIRHAIASLRGVTEIGPHPDWEPGIAWTFTVLDMFVDIKQVEQRKVSGGPERGGHTRYEYRLTGAGVQEKQRLVSELS